jgi:hypothetical protein
MAYRYLFTLRATIREGELSILAPRARVIRVTPSWWADSLKAAQPEQIADCVPHLARPTREFNVPVDLCAALP